jgi:hypothetical protein
MWLFESPWTIVIGGVALTVMFGGGWIQTGQKPALIGAVVALALTGVLLAVERFLVTDREEVTRTLHQIAADVASNDVERVLDHIHPYREEVKELARHEMPRYKFDEVRITKVHNVTVNEAFIPKQAIIEFNVVVTGSSRQGLDQGKYPRFVIVTFLQDGDRWKISNYQHHEPQLGWQRRE